MNSSAGSGVSNKKKSLCPTGLLIDFDTNQEEPDDNKNEYNDTFGLFDHPSRPQMDGNAQPLIPPPLLKVLNDTCPEGGTPNTTFSPFGLGIKKNNSGIRRIKSAGADPFSPIFNTNSFVEIKKSGGADPFSPFAGNTPVKRNKSEEGAAANLSDSDSLLDIANLSGFSVSSVEGHIEEQLLMSKLKLVEEPLEARQQMKTPPQTKKKFNEEEQVPVFCIDRDTVEKKRRESINQKLQRLSHLMNTPASSPPSPNPNYMATPKTPATLRNHQIYESTPKSTVSTMTSPRMSSTINTVADSVKSTRVVESPRASCNRYFGLRPVVLVKPKMGNCLEDEETNSIKRLSFGSSTSESSSSPTKSVKNIESLFRPIATVRAAQKTTQPLKANVVLPSASAPPTRKFIPPMAHSSPLPESRRNSLHLGTPPRKAPVKSSGYGQQSMNTSLNSSGFKMPPSPRRPASAQETKAKSIPMSPRMSNISGRQIMVAKGQIPQPNNNPTTALKSLKPVEVTNIKPSGLCAPKENKPKILTSSLPRPGFMFCKK